METDKKKAGLLNEELNNYQKMLSRIYLGNHVINLINIDNDVLFEMLCAKDRVKRLYSDLKKDKEIGLIFCNKNEGYFKLKINKKVIEKKKLENEIKKELIC